MNDLLPNADKAYVVPAKIRDYLLAPRTTSDKSGFFQRFGFRRDRWQVLEGALLQHAHENFVAGHERTDAGVKYFIEGPLWTPDGRNPMVRTVWEITPEVRAPRFVTAIPLGRRYERI